MIRIPQTHNRRYLFRPGPSNFIKQQSMARPPSERITQRTTWSIRIYARSALRVFLGDSLYRTALVVGVESLYSIPNQGNDVSTYPSRIPMPSPVISALPSIPDPPSYHPYLSQTLLPYYPICPTIYPQPSSWSPLTHRLNLPPPVLGIAFICTC